MYVTSGHSYDSITPCLLRFPDEKNEKSKLLIRTKINEYLSRAETLKEHMNAQSEKRGKSAVGANGSSTGIGPNGRQCVSNLVSC